MNPYADLPAHQYWKSQISEVDLANIDYDPAPKWQFDLATDRFATAGSCFAQHFTREIRAAGGFHVETEQRHPLVPAAGGHGYGLFSARYGNIYTCRQLRELLEQAFEVRPVVHDCVQDERGRWLDLLRLRAVPDGFSSRDECEIDRRYHLSKVRAIFRECSVFVFTLGLTECWENSQLEICYPLCPGVIPGGFQADRHRFINLDFDRCVADLATCIEMIVQVNPGMRILLTVSPVMLVATQEARGALQSSITSKSILRAVADQCCRRFESVDYFPSYEIIAGPQSAGRFYQSNRRDVSEQGVKFVMKIFFERRVVAFTSLSTSASSAAKEQSVDHAIAEAAEVECDEILLGKRDG
jgi:hypothetical protein